MIIDEEQLNENFSIEESNTGIVVLKYRGQEIASLQHSNSFNIIKDRMLPVLSLIRKHKEEYHET